MRARVHACVCVCVHARACALGGKGVSGLGTQKHHILHVPGSCRVLVSGLGFHGNGQPSTVCPSLDQLTVIGSRALVKDRGWGGGSIRPSMSILEKRSTRPSMDILEMRTLDNTSPPCIQNGLFQRLLALSPHLLQNGLFHQKGSSTFLVNSTQALNRFRDFPGSPGGKTPCSQCRGPGFDPWSGK